MNIKKLYTFLLLMTFAVASAQQKPVQASIDSTKIKIGSQASLSVKATVAAGTRVRFPEGKNFGQLEVLESYPVDTVKKDGKLQLVKKYGLTQFDPGKFTLPKLPVVINNKTEYTDELKLEVTDVKVDTLKQKLFDIKPIMQAESSSKWWIYVLVVLVFAAMGYGIWRYIKRTKDKVQEEPVDTRTPIEKATEQLQQLEQKQLLQHGEVKEYYSELTNIARTYIEEAIHIPAMESTTGELIEAMHEAIARKKMDVNAETFERLEQVLRTADMVKFAKSRPQENSIAEDRSSIENIITRIDRSIPEEKAEDNIEDKAREEALLKKKAKRRRVITIASFIAGFLLAFAASVYIFGKEYLQDNFFGHPTSELLEGEWVKSEYGDPGVIIETPKVLKRIDISGKLPKEMMERIKSLSAFGYGSFFDSFMVSVTTMTFKDPINFNLEAGVEGVIKEFEAQGASTILVKTDGFATGKGIEGIRAYGTMNMPEKLGGNNSRVYYELFFFKQAGGLQQVMVLHKDGDTYGSQILERIKNSIELRNYNQPWTK
jgi:hypothetical protein